MFRLCLVAIAVVAGQGPIDDSTSGIYPGDLLLGGLFPIHGRGPSGDCDKSGVEWDGIFTLEAFYLSLDQVNVRLRACCGFTLGAVTEDTCFNEKHGLIKSGVEWDGIFTLEAFYLSLDQVNVRLRACCGFTLGAVTEDTCFNEKHGLIKSLKFVLKHMLPAMGKKKDIPGAHDVIGVVGPMSSDVAIQVGNLLGMFKIPQISYAATSAALSNAERFPYFLRTVPSDLEQAFALIHILQHYNWTYVGAIYEDGNYGLRGFQELEKEARKKGICFADKIPVDVDSPVGTKPEFFQGRLRRLAKEKPRLKVVVLYVTLHIALRIFEAAKAEGLTGHFVWVGTDGWGSRFIPTGLRMGVEELSEVVSGAIVSHPVWREIPEFRDYFFNLRPKANERNPWFNHAWESAHGCTLEEGTNDTCTATQLESIANQVEGTEFGYMHFVREAVWAFGESVREMHSIFCDSAQGVCPRLKVALQDDDTKPHSLINTLRRVSFPGSKLLDAGMAERLSNATVFSFSEGREGRAVYSVMTYARSNTSCCSSFAWLHSGFISKEYARDQPFFNPRPDQDKDRPYPNSSCGRKCGLGMIRRYQSDKCCWTCERCPFPTYRFNITHCAECPNGTDGAVSAPDAFGNGCVPVNVTRLGYDDVSVIAVVSGATMGIVLTLLFSLFFFAYSSTPIIKAAGRELSWVLLLGILLCYATVFLIVLRPSPFTCGLVRVFYSLSYTVCYAAIFVKINRIARIFHVSKTSGPRRTRYTSPVSQVVLVASIILFQVILMAIWLLVKPPSSDTRRRVNFDAKVIEVVLFCEAFEDFDMLFALLIPVLLIFLSAFYGFKSRKCPGKFNETRYIILTTYTTCVVWLAFIPVFFTTERMNIRVFALCASLTLNATVTLLCLFTPKLYVAICRPHKNTKEAVMGRKKNQSKLETHSDCSSGNGSPSGMTLSDPPLKPSLNRSRKDKKLSLNGPPLNSSNHSEETEVSSARPPMAAPELSPPISP